jgi:hypothetical protein
MKRLRTWLGKHQEEMLNDSGKQKLIGTVEAYFRFCSKADPTFESELGETAQALISDLLKLPEGKLIRNSGGKSKALKWLDATQQSSKSGGKPAASASTTSWNVADVDAKGKLTLMSANGDDMCEDVAVTDAAMLKRIRSAFEADETVTVELDGLNVVVKVIVGDDDGDDDEKQP